MVRTSLHARCWQTPRYTRARNASADTYFCEECGVDGQLCCPALALEMTDPICDEGYGCTNDQAFIYERSCKACGANGSPCCWTRWEGYTCAGSLQCTGEVGGARCVVSSLAHRSAISIAAHICPANVPQDVCLASQSRIQRGILHVSRQILSRLPDPSFGCS